MARSIVKVIGFSDRVIGNSKTTGKPFDFRKVAFSFENAYGQNDVSINSVDGAFFETLDIQVGSLVTASVIQVKNTYYIDIIDSV